MKKLAGLVLAMTMFVPFAAFADSTISASATGAATISPSGTVSVPTGNTQSFVITGAMNVVVDGASLGSLASYDFTGDAFDHSITALGSIGAGMIYCSGPSAPGWNVSLPNGGCGAPKAPVYLPTQTVQNADGSYTFGVIY